MIIASSVMPLKFTTAIPIKKDPINLFPSNTVLWFISVLKKIVASTKERKMICMALKI
jgi:hypothetical protein